MKTLYYYFCVFHLQFACPRITPIVTKQGPKLSVPYSQAIQAGSFLLCREKIAWILIGHIYRKKNERQTQQVLKI